MAKDKEKDKEKDGDKKKNKLQKVPDILQLLNLLHSLDGTGASPV
jgi:hypothetical protein